MRSVSRAARSDDRGAVLVWVAISLIVLLGMGAMVLDVGALYQERRELQNGADAAALAVAKDCAAGDCQDEFGTADNYADENANDDASNVPLVCGDGPGLSACPTPPPGAGGVSGWVKVDTSTHNPDNAADDEQIDFVLAPVLDAANVGETVTASAVAAWGPAGQVTTIPFTFSLCEFEAMGGSLDGLQFPDQPGYVYQHGNGPDHSCPGNPSGQNLPGGFGWLDQSAGCEATIDIDDLVGSDTGNSFPQDCDPATWQNAEVLIPLYNEVSESGSHGEYRIVGFAGFRVHGYKFGNQNEWNMPTGSCPGTPGNSGRCFYGEFTHVTTTGGIGGGTDFGARAVEMIG